MSPMGGGVAGERVFLYFRGMQEISESMIKDAESMIKNGARAILMAAVAAREFGSLGKK